MKLSKVHINVADYFSLLSEISSYLLANSLDGNTKQSLSKASGSTTASGGGEGEKRSWKKGEETLF